MAHISKNLFETFNWLLAEDGFNQSINSVILRCFESARLNDLRTRNKCEPSANRT